MKSNASRVSKAAKQPTAEAEILAHPTTDPQVPALERGLAVLELLARSPTGRTLADITTALSLPAASAFRIASALEQLGYLQRDSVSKTFTLTKKLLLLGQPRGSGLSLSEACIDAMRKVRDKTSETTQLCCLTNEQCVVLEQLPSLHPFKYIVDLGSRPPAYCAAPGKAMLAFLPEAEQAVAIEQIRFVKHTSRTITSRSAFVRELREVRSRGYAVDHGEHFDGIHCVAAPLLDQHGNQIAAITIAGPSQRIPAHRFPELGQLIRAAANEAALKFLG
jgi:DNA-binding IclR family transcriptional regulator